MGKLYEFRAATTAHDNAVRTLAQRVPFRRLAKFASGVFFRTMLFTLVMVLTWLRTLFVYGLCFVSVLCLILAVFFYFIPSTSNRFWMPLLFSFGAFSIAFLYDWTVSWIAELAGV